MNTTQRMKKTDKAQIKKKVDVAIAAILNKLNLTKTSKKTSRAISKASKALRKDIEAVLKKKNSSKKSAKKVSVKRLARAKPADGIASGAA